MSDDIVYGSYEMQEKCEGLWDNVSELKKWLPIIVLLKEAKDATDLSRQLEAVVSVADFALGALGKKPSDFRAYRLLALLASLVKTNPEVRAEVEKLLKG